MSVLDRNEPPVVDLEEVVVLPAGYDGPEVHDWLNWLKRLTLENVAPEVRRQAEQAEANRVRVAAEVEVPEKPVAAEVMLGYFRQILGESESLVFNPLLKTYDDTAGWSNHLKLYFDQAVAFDQLISESAKEGRRDYAILGAAALTRVGQLVFSRIPEGAKVDIGELRKLYQEAVERYLSRLTSISK